MPHFKFIKTVHLKHREPPILPEMKKVQSLGGWIVFSGDFGLFHRDFCRICTRFPTISNNFQQFLEVLFPRMRMPLSFSRIERKKCFFAQSRKNLIEYESFHEITQDRNLVFTNSRRKFIFFTHLRRTNVLSFTQSLRSVGGSLRKNTTPPLLTGPLENPSCSQRGHL